jgi:putative nucleotidyltransferase with HDIG domain
MDDPHSSAADFGAIVSSDPSLTVRLLQLVNSAFFGFPSRIESVSQAVTVVGTNQLQDLALATSVIVVFRDIPEDLVNMESFWRHSLGCAVTARVFAANRGESNVERLFVAALLHDVGRLIMFQANPEEARRTLKLAGKHRQLLHVVERDTLGYDHAAVGMALIGAWNLPENLQEPVGYHHQPEKARRFPVDAAIVHVSDVTTHAMVLGHSGERFVPPLSRNAWLSVNKTDSVSLSSINNIRRQYDAAVQVILRPEV